MAATKQRKKTVGTVRKVQLSDLGGFRSITVGNPDGTITVFPVDEIVVGTRQWDGGTEVGQFRIDHIECNEQAVLTRIQE